jgi:prepilin signal peptidase PulO-like enzyme (type II secretory pathway)
MIYLVFLIGLVFGSFSSVLISEFCNLIDGGSFNLKRFLYGRSKCLECQKNLKWYNLIPVLSYVIQLGKCSNCKVKISKLYVLIEVLMGVLFSSIYSLYGFSLDFFISIIISFISLIIFFVDLKTMKIPTVLSWSLIVFGVIYGFIVNDLSLTFLLSGGLLGFLFFYLQNVVSKGKWVGLGDADLGLAIGVMFGPLVGLYTILQSYVFGTVVLVPMMLLDRDKYSAKSQVPFGPFLIFGLIFSIFFGNIVVEWYVQNYIIF